MPDQQTTDEQTSDAMLPALWRDSIFGPREVPGGAYAGCSGLSLRAVC
jgi:hypothetical protein